MSDVPSATVVQGGKLEGDVPKGGGEQRPRTPHTRKLSNYLLDARLQLRYILLVTVLSGVISGSLGYLIYQQRHAATSAIEGDLAALTQDDRTYDELREVVAAEYDAADRMLMYKMVGVGIGLVVILSLYLVMMTHKVAGPLYKVTLYFEKMSDGKLGTVTALRQGDMLQDFYGNFREMHEAVRARAQADASALEAAAGALRGGAGASAKLGEALDQLDQHVARRKRDLQ